MLLHREQRTENNGGCIQHLNLHVMCCEVLRTVRGMSTAHAGVPGLTPGQWLTSCSLPFWRVGNLPQGGMHLCEHGEESFKVHTSNGTAMGIACFTAQGTARGD